MIDMHSHILPKIDDGAESVEMSIEMLLESKKQGVDTIIATPHCYLHSSDDIDSFLEDRNKSYNLLMDAIKGKNLDIPDIVLGCEVHIAFDASEIDDLNKLCINNTNYILLEMPFHFWNTQIVESLYSLTLKGFRPIVAHVERFYHHRKFFGTLSETDLLFQVNAESVLAPKTKKIVADLFRHGMVNLIGSDMHNTTTRPQTIGKAYKEIMNSYGMGCIKYLTDNSNAIIENYDVGRYPFKKLGFFEKKKLKKDMKKATKAGDV